MQKIFENLATVRQKIAEAPDPATLKTNSDFMNPIVEHMNHALYLLQLGVALAPTESTASRGHTRNKAIVTGHMVRLAKLYEGFLIHVSGRKLELAVIFVRLIFETAVKMRYLAQAKASSFQSYILTSYRPEKEILQDLASKAKQRELIPIEKRMMRKIKSRLKKDRISIDALMQTTRWEIDGKSVRAILQHLQLDLAYPYAYGSSSHSIHGDWYELSLHHLQRKGRYYSPDLSFDDPDPRVACPITIFCLRSLIDYIDWARADPNEIVLPTIEALIELFTNFDNAHELTLGT